MKWSEFSKKKKTWIIVIGVLFVLWVIGSFSSKNTATSTEPAYTEYNEMKDVAKFYADRLLEQQLKYPDGWSYEREQLDRLDSVTYKMTAIVLAKNAFNVRSRILFNFKIQYVGSMADSYGDYETRYKPDNWKVVTNEVVE